MPIRRCWGADWPLSQSAGKAPARSSPDLKTKRFRKLVVVSPDVGGLKMAYAYSQVLGGGLAIVAKRRKSASEVESRSEDKAVPQTGGGESGRGRAEDGLCLFAGAGGRTGHCRKAPEKRQRGRVHGRSE